MDEPVFVVGCDRSGTSLLSLILGQSPDLHMIFEAGFLPHLKCRAEDYGRFDQAKQRWYFVRDIQRAKATPETYAFDKFENITDEEAESAVDDAAPTDYRGAADAIYSASARKAGKGRWGEKMPRYVTQVKWLASTFPSSQIVHIIRDPRDVSASICRAGWAPSIRGAAKNWKNKVSTGREQGFSIDEGRYHEIKYEALLGATKSTVMELSTKLGLEFTDEMCSDFSANEIPKEHLDQYSTIFEKLNEEIDESRAQAWKREMNGERVAIVEEVAKDLMERLDYHVTQNRISVQRRIKKWAVEKAKYVGRKILKNER